MKLGTFPSMTGSDARLKSLELKATASAGRDPVAELEDRQIEVAINRELVEAKGRRFFKAVDEYMRLHQAGRVWAGEFTQLRHHARVGKTGGERSFAAIANLMGAYSGIRPRAGSDNTFSFCAAAVPLEPEVGISFYQSVGGIPGPELALDPPL